MVIYFAILIIMTLVGSVASFFLKKASSSGTILDFIKNKNIYIGGTLYLLSALLNIYILKFLDYSVVLPLTSITYIWTLILSYKLLHEKISKKKILGVAFIVLGAVLVGIKV